MIEWKGEIVQRDYGAKVKQLNQTVTALNFQIDQYKKLVARMEEDAEAAKEREDILKEEVKRLRINYRNFKARVTPPKEPNA
jgi:outer membrane murein-binding lipoprotein Lpp